MSKMSITRPAESDSDIERAVIESLTWKEDVDWADRQLVLQDETIHVDISPLVGDNDELAVRKWVDIHVQDPMGIDIGDGAFIATKVVGIARKEGRWLLELSVEIEQAKL